jgi:uncharacterized protein YoxC
MVLEPESFDYKKHLALKHIYLGEIDPAKDILFNLLETEEENTRNYAFTTYYLGLVYEIEQNPELVKKYYLLSAIADIKSSIRENASFQKLASIYYEEGDIDKAFRYTQSAIEDAVFCNVQFRTTQMSRFYSIINATYAEKESEAKAQLLLFLMLISLLSLLLVLLVVYVYRQMRKLSRVKEELSVAYDKLIELNNVLNKTNQQLLEKNDQLSESNLVKEQYIAQFFDLCSAYIDKMEDYRKSLYKLGINDQIDKLIKKLKSTTEVDKELEDLYKNFDRIFLNLYPTFVSDFNSLLIEEERIILKSEGILNKELRIYALLRLGITDSVRIAAFLRCSLSTVYNYRTKIRNKAAISREEFEIVVEKIGSIRKNNE